MAVYLKRFETHSEYETYINGQDVTLPNVSACNDVPKEAHFNPVQKEYFEQYLTLEALGTGTLGIITNNSAVTRTIFFSVDDGLSWTEITTSQDAYSFGNFVAGDKVLIKGNNISYAQVGSQGMPSGVYFTETTPYKVYGNIMSIFYGDYFVDNYELPSGGTYSCAGLFSKGLLIDASNLILPATALTNNCYAFMFYNCSGLTTAPVLPATTLANYCYQSMFNNCYNLTEVPELPATTLTTGCYMNLFTYCRNLNYIKAMFTTTPDPGYTYGWVQGVAETGTFVKNSAAQWDVTGNNGIPSGWTVETASA